MDLDDIINEMAKEEMQTLTGIEKMFDRFDKMSDVELINILRANWRDLSREEIEVDKLKEHFFRCLTYSVLLMYLLHRLKNKCKKEEISFVKDMYFIISEKLRYMEAIYQEVGDALIKDQKVVDFEELRARKEFIVGSNLRTIWDKIIGDL